MFVLAVTLNVLITGTAAAKLPLPGCVAVIEHEPTDTSTALVLPTATVQTAGVVLAKATVNPEVAAPTNATGPAFNAVSTSGLNVIDCDASVTSILALDVLPVPPSVELIVTLLFLVPTVVPCTVTTIVHGPAPPATVPPVNCTVLEFGKDAVPPQPLFVTLPVPIRPACRLSVNASPFRVMAPLGFVIVNVNEVVLFSGMLVRVKALVIVGGVATMRVAVLLATPVPPFDEVIVPAPLTVLL